MHASTDRHTCMHAQTQSITQHHAPSLSPALIALIGLPQGGYSSWAHSGSCWGAPIPSRNYQRFKTLLTSSRCFIARSDSIGNVLYPCPQEHVIPHLPSGACSEIQGQSHLHIGHASSLPLETISWPRHPVSLFGGVVRAGDAVPIPLGLRPSFL